MIDFRYHLVSIVAVFLALTVGIVLGTTMLQDPLLHSLQSTTSDLRERAEDLRAQKEVADEVSRGGDELVSAYSDDMLADRLNGVGVVVLEAPGVRERTRDGVVSRIEQAGGTVTGRLAFTDRFLDTDRSTFVNELTEQLSGGTDLPQGNPYERAGAELARAVLRPEKAGRDNGGAGADGARSPAPETRPDTGAGGESGTDAAGHFDAEAVLAGFSEAGLLTTRGEPAQSADIGVVLAPARPFAHPDTRTPGEGATPPGNGVMLALTRALDDAANGAVLAGGASSIGGDGLIAQAREQEAPFTTVDVAGRTTGDVVTALAVASAVDGRSGHYGIGEGVDGFLPDPLPEPRDREQDEGGTTSASPAPPKDAKG